MKESKLPLTETISTQRITNNHSFRNMMLLILFVLGIWSWFNYLPQHAIDTISMLNYRAGVQINKRMGIETISNTDYSLMLPSSIITNMVPTSTGREIISGNNSTGVSQTESIITGTSSIMSATQTGNNQTGSSIRDEIDTKAIRDIATPITTSGKQALMNKTTANTPLSITIGGQTITLDGTPNEDIIINGKGYRVTVQKN